MVSNTWHKALTALLILVMPTPGSTSMLSELEWQHRPLLVFAQQDDPAFQQTRQLLEDYQCQLDDREMIILLVPEQGSGRLGAGELPADEATRLRNEFGVSGRELTTILVGKDGGEKYRTTGVPDLNRIFSLIDGMPMRQQEMHLNPAACSSPRHTR